MEAKKTRSEIKSELDALVARIKFAKGILCDESPNNLLREHYALQGHTELKTFSQWHAEGYRIKAGAESLKLWSSPKVGRSKSIDEESGEELVYEFEYYGYIVLFSQLQVEKDDSPKKVKKYRRTYNRSNAK